MTFDLNDEQRLFIAMLLREELSRVEILHNDIISCGQENSAQAYYYEEEIKIIRSILDMGM
jgi:hypothetical protein